MQEEIKRIRRCIREAKQDGRVLGLECVKLILGRIQRVAITEYVQTWPYGKERPNLKECTFQGLRVEWSDDLDTIKVQ